MRPLGLRFLVAVLGIAFFAGHVSAQQLIDNPGFEGGIVSWSLSAGTAVYAVDSTVQHSGSFAAKGVETDPNSLGRLYQDVTGRLIPGREYVLSGWIKAEGVTGGGFIIGVDYVASGGWTPGDGYVAEIGHVLGTQDWTFFKSVPFVLPPMPTDASALWVLTDFNVGAGTAWTDDLRLSPAGQTVFLVHGIGQTAADMRNLTSAILDPTFGINTHRFVVDATFEYSNCPPSPQCSCTIQDGGRRLAEHIINYDPDGDVVLVGYSMGGLIARDMIVNNYAGVLRDDRRVAALITLGTPNLGYPYMSIDNNAKCPSLLHQMEGDFRTPASGVRVDFFDQQRQRVAGISPYLWSLNTNWPSAQFLPGVWSAIAGTFCSAPVRNASNNGCSDAHPDNDGVVCEQSATYSTDVGGALNALLAGPTRRLADPFSAHTDNWRSWFVFCGNVQSLPPLFNPEVGLAVLAEIVTVINGLP
jgi:pimeloyl-ACP methyl ester carboxylesterase